MGRRKRRKYSPNLRGMATEPGQLGYFSPDSGTLLLRVSAPRLGVSGKKWVGDNKDGNWVWRRARI